jgi:hypothetical protein
MKVQTAQGLKQIGLEELIPKVEAEVQKFLEERKTLQLSTPEDFLIYLNHYSHEHALAGALYAQTPLIVLNALKMTSYQLEGEDKQKINRILQYFDATRPFFVHESWILHSLQNSEDPIKTFEQKAFPDPARLQGFKEGFKTRGRTYEEYEKYILENVGTINKYILELMPKIKEEFKKSDLYTLRHEIDHLDFYTSPIFIEHNGKYQKATRLQQELESGNTSVSKEYAQSKLELLKSTTEIVPLLEARAWFFNFVPISQWDKGNFEELKGKVYHEFWSQYIEASLPPKIIETLIAQKWSKGEMDTATSNFLFHTVSLQSQSANSKAYIVEPEKVNYDIANKVLYQEIPEWKAKLAQNARTAVEAIGNAYRDQPSRLKEANSAKTFEEFIEKCKG